MPNIPQNILNKSRINLNKLFLFIICLFQILPYISADASDLNSHYNSNGGDTVLSNEKIDTVKIKKIISIAWDLAISDVDKSISYADSAIKLCEQINWEKGKAYALNNKGESLRYKGLFHESLDQHQLALEILRKLNILSDIAKTESDIGIVYFSLGDFSNSFEHFDSALEIYKSINNKEGILNLYGYIGVVFSSFDQHEKSIEYFEKAIELTKELKDESKMATQLNNLGLTYLELKRYKEAIVNFQKAIEIFQNLDDDYNYSLTLGNLGIPYSELKEYKRAEEYYHQSLEYAKKLGDQYGVAHQYGNLGELFLKMAKDHDLLILDQGNNYASRAIKYLILSIDEFDVLDAISDKKDYLIMLSEGYTLTHNFENALKFFKEAIVLQDSIQSNENQQVIAGLEIKQELDKKENEIILLSKEKENESIIKIGLSTLVILIFIISILIYSFYKKKKDDNLVLEKNIMLREEVEKALRQNEKELTKHQNNLEILVRDRTRKLENEIIEHKETEEELLLAIERAEIANNAKSVFLTNMSHELRTPLVGILGYSDLLTTIVEDEDARDMAEGINRTGNRLLSTLSLVLDLARIESDKFEIDISQVDVIRELKETYQNFKAMAEKKKIKINLNVHSNTFFHATDLSMLKIILDNLVNNAIKFTKEGEINLISDIIHEEGSAKLVIKVSDTGVGIKRDDIPLIFEEFKQLSEGFTKDFQGSGLGLSITKKFVQLLGGTIRVESHLGKGSTFIITFPTEIKAVA